MNDSASIDVDLLRQLHSLTALDAQGLHDLATLFRRERIERGIDPLRIGNWRDHLVFLVKGELKLTFADNSTSVLVGGSKEAAQPLGKWGLAPISTRAITNIELLFLADDELDIMLTWDQMARSRQSPDQPDRIGGSDAGDGANGTDWRRMSGLFSAQNLTRGVFAALPPAHIDQLLQRFRRITVRRGEEIVRQGETGDYYYLIESGRCQVTRLVAGASITLADLQPGDAFGEEALVADATRNANVTMKTDGILLRLEKQDFIELLRAPLLHTLPHDKAIQRVAAGAVWLDVRCAAEYRYDCIDGALNLPLDDIRKAYSVLDPLKEYIVYCQSGRRSSAATFLLAKRGLRASLLEGGLAGRGRGRCDVGDSMGAQQP